MQQPPSQPRMPMPDTVPQSPMSAPQATQQVQQAERKRTREVPKEQLNAAMQKASEAVATALYKNRKIGQSALKMINERSKVGSTAKAVTQLLSEVNKRAQIPPRLMPALAAMTADEMMTMAESTNRTTYSDQEAQQVIFTTMEMVLTAHGVDPNRAKQLASQMSAEDLKKAESAYKGALGEGGDV